MKIEENIFLKRFTTFQIGGKARYFTVAKSEEDLREAFTFVKSRKLPIFILGGGSNLLVSEQGFPGLVVKNEIRGVKFIDQLTGNVILEIGAGETLDDVVTLSVIRNLSGLENLSGVPGTVGGAVVQNAGAYGREISQNIIEVQGLNSVNGKSFTFKKADCQYSYRTSLFKNHKKFVITSVKLQLSKKADYCLEHIGLKEKMAEQGGEITAQGIRTVLLKIREDKLPDWHKIGTAGSFFKNPIISQLKYKELKEKFSDLPGFECEVGKIKVSLAWILDHICHLKGYQDKTVGLYLKQPLVIVNLGEAKAEEVKIFSEKIKNIVKDKIGIEIEEEVEKINF